MIARLSQRSPASTVARGRAQFEVERFERVAAGSGALLLRVAGRWRAGAELDLGPASLLVDDGRATHCLEALPGPDATTAAADRAGRPWRAAFAAPAHLLDGGPRAFSLQAGGVVVPLPAPVPAPARNRTNLQRDLEGARQQAASARVEAAGLRTELDELKARLEEMELGALEALATGDEGMEASQAEASAERARAERLEQEVERLRAELRALREDARLPRLPAAPAGEGPPARTASPPPILPSHRPQAAWPRSTPGGLPAEWLVALFLLGVGVVVVLLILSGGAFL